MFFKTIRKNNPIYIDTDTIYKKYIVKFNINSMPLDFETANWKLYDKTNKNLIKKSDGTKLIELKGQFFIIESLEQDIMLELGGQVFYTGLTKIYLPCLYSFLGVFIKLTDNINIYELRIDSDISNNIKLLDNQSDFFTFITSFPIFFEDLTYNKTNSKPIFYHGMYGFDDSKFYNLDCNAIDNIFFNDLIKCVKDEDKEYIDDIIYFIDKYIQYDIIKIVQVKK